MPSASQECERRAIGCNGGFLRAGYALYIYVVMSAASYFNTGNHVKLFEDRNHSKTIFVDIGGVYKLSVFSFDRKSLGYPAYVLPISGTWKVFAVLVILMPNYRLAKEWAYAGLFFLLTGGVVSHLANGDGLLGALPVLIFSVLTVVS